ncbi:radical SAM protein [Streptomyces sp. NPDC086783]|uniref:radical SAM protein n=1 Tax=Streptomyces sp. NPDC086783 TaxID=3365758 RepID=UPI00382787AB
MPATSLPTAGPDDHQDTVPFRQLLLKVHSRCNLACTYGYMYEAADQSWRRRPRTMAPEVVSRTAGLIAAHAREHALGRVDVVSHGGEPLLVGAERLAALLQTPTDALTEVAELRLTMQTNGIQLVEDPDLLPVLDRYGVRVGVSLDGTAALQPFPRMGNRGRQPEQPCVRTPYPAPAHSARRLVRLTQCAERGALEQADSLKASYPGAPASGVHVLSDAFADVAAHPGFRARQRGTAGLGLVCRARPRSRACGGGLYTHRYHPGSTPLFAAPSVYCDDLAVLIDHIGDKLRRDVARLAPSGREAIR